MPLLDHFHPPLREQRHWTSLHGAWAANIAADLNQYLPERYFAEPHVQFGIEIDVAALEGPPRAMTREQAVAYAPAGSDVEWTPPAPAQTVSFPLVDDAVEVKIFSTEAGPVLVGAIELVSPGNKDRPAHREAFVSKCETYLQRAVGLVIVDIVTERKANLHNELLERLGPPEASPLEAELYATAYRVVERDEQPSLDTWEETLAVGRPLPTVPLWLQGDLCLPVDLDGTYERTCREQRIPTQG